MALAVLDQHEYHRHIFCFVTSNTFIYGDADVCSLADFALDVFDQNLIDYVSKLPAGAVAPTADGHVWDLQETQQLLIPFIAAMQHGKTQDKSNK